MTRKKMYTSDNPGYEAVKAYRESRKIVRVPLDMPNDEAAALRQYCADHGLTVAGFIRGLIRDAIAAGADLVQAGTGGGIEAALSAGVSPISTEK
ncbi:MAG: hypothetical protein IJV40_03180 [Oscillospiraceae bacterium]|nr:hypothetical protein [Oscillospiraceae bacterium]